MFIASRISDLKKEKKKSTKITLTNHLDLLLPNELTRR